MPQHMQQDAVSVNEKPSRGMIKKGGFAGSATGMAAQEQAGHEFSPQTHRLCNALMMQLPACPQRCADLHLAAHNAALL